MSPNLLDARRLMAGNQDADNAYLAGKRVWDVPRAIPGCVLCLDARELAVANGAPVDVWPDLAEGNHAVRHFTQYNQTIMDTTGINGRPAVRFLSGPCAMLTPPITTRTLMFVTRHIPNSNGHFADYHRLFGASVAGNPNIHTLFGILNYPNYNPFSASFNVGFKPPNFWIDGVLTTNRTPLGTPKVVVATAEATQGPLVHAIGHYMDNATTPAGSGQGLDGWLGAVCAWDRALTLEERLDVQRWAKNGWGTA